ncbi:MAG: translation initiation factor IF-2 N-terminal domain-containing protein, partial [Lentisphaeria bacterium]|nr:translation initiation factor IF-2 N-terminal domain-containing protein [Lentisphaeria bacterium]
MEKKKMNVKAFADLYGMTSKEVLKELAAQGFTLIRTATSNIPPEDLELIAAYFDELTGKVKPKEESRSIADDYDDLEETGGKEKIKSSSGAAKGKKRDEDNERFRERNRGKNKNSGNAERNNVSASVADDAPREVSVKTPLIVKNLAEALGKKPNEVITALMMMNVLASLNQTVDFQVVKKVAEQEGITLILD